GGELLYWNHGSAQPGPDRRHLVAACGYRAAGPGLRPVDLYRVLVLRPGPGRPAGQRVPVRLLGLPGRVQPEPDLRLRRADGPGLRHGGRTDPVPAGRAGAADPVRGEKAAGRHRRTLAETRSRDRETCV